MKDDRNFLALEAFLGSVPGVQAPLSHGLQDNGQWWVKFSIDIKNDLAWHVVQELGHVLNYLSVQERLPTVFKPVSPPPYMNGGPAEFLSWVIECSDAAFDPGKAATWLEGRLPQPVHDTTKWGGNDDA
jgi:hypothetical protein